MAGGSLIRAAHLHGRKQLVKLIGLQRIFHHGRGLLKAGAPRWGIVKDGEGALVQRDEAAEHGAGSRVLVVKVTRFTCVACFAHASLSLEGVGGNWDTRG